ncbi:MAG: GAF domain-containing protein [Chloroflexota bacterium]
MQYDESILNSSSRLEVLHKLSLIDSDEEPFFDRLTVIASRLLGSPISLVSMVGADHQFFKSSHGLPAELQVARQNPLTYPLCQYVVTSGEPLIVTDATINPALKNNLGVTEFNVRSYLGMPLTTDDGERLGSFCVMDMKPREWSDDEIAVIKAFTDVVNTEIEGRAQAHYENRLDDYIATAKPQLDQFETDVNATDSLPEVVTLLESLRMDILLSR